MFVFDVALRLSVALHETSTKVKRRLAALIVAMVALNPALALAGSGGLTDMFESAATGADDTVKSGIKISRAVGFFSVLGGIAALKGKKDNPHIKGWHIVLAVVVGVFLICLPEIIKRSQHQVGLQEVDIG